MEAINYFNLTCPHGGNFYICENSPTEFIGCCTSDPCTTSNQGKCPTRNLKVATFNPEKYAELRAQDCDHDDSISIWYSCTSTVPPFMGCCLNNPCANGTCETGNLVPAKLASYSANRNAFLRPGPSSTISTSTVASTTTSTSSTTSTTTPTHSSNTASGTPSSVPATSSTVQSSGLSAGAIGGISAAVVVAAIIAIGIILYKCGWRAKRKQDPAPPTGMVTHGMPPAEPSPGLGIMKDNMYDRESYLSGATAVSHPSPAHLPPLAQGLGPHAQHYSPFQNYADGFQFPAMQQHHQQQPLLHNSYGHYRNLSGSTDGGGLPGYHAPLHVPPVELPLTQQISVQELPEAQHRTATPAQPNMDPPTTPYLVSPGIATPPTGSPPMNNATAFGQQSPRQGPRTLRG
ncbi:hypothetical protein QBC35DRAFT_124549 [Podospora australis]|uniref:Uncharacterized protein n=1 Tax=Podospora australis TaxID=1536484 RepID=A0AAN6WJY0_9PEZI|nr:hypothetical protein QBC35DRAFT_124549 [Podospora australis]